MFKKLSKSQLLNLKDEIDARQGQVVSMNILNREDIDINLFAFGDGESISEEIMHKDYIYFILDGNGRFNVSGDTIQVSRGEMIFIPESLPYSSNAVENFKLLEISYKEEKDMGKINYLEKAKVINLKDVVQYDKGKVVSTDLVKRDDLIICMFAFDEGEGLPTHSAPGDALVQILDGEALIYVEDEEFHLKEGESIVFRQNGAHSLKAIKPFKMLLTVVK